MPERKPPSRVVDMAGKPLRPGTISQAELQEIARLQDAEWLASRIAHQAIIALEERLDAKEHVEPGDLKYDRAKRMVRTRRELASGE
jgi:hypothetical protein